MGCLVRLSLYSVKYDPDSGQLVPEFNCITGANVHRIRKLMSVRAEWIYTFSVSSVMGKNSPETKSNLPHLIQSAHVDGLQIPAKCRF